MINRIFRKYKKKIILYVFMGIVAALCNVLSVVELQKAVDILGGNYGKATLSMVLYPVLLYGIFSILHCVLNYLDNIPSTQLEEGIFYFLKTEAIKKIQRIDYNEYTHFGTGQLIQVVENGAEAGVNIVFKFFIELFYGLLPSLIFSLIVLGTYDARVMLLIAIGYVMVFLVTNTLLKYLHKYQERALVDSEWLSSRFVRAIMEMGVFRLNRRFPYEIKDLENKSKQIVSNETKVTIIHEFFFAFFYFLIIIVKVLIIIFGLMFNLMSIGKIIAIIMLIDNIYGPIAEFNILFVKYKIDKVAFSRFTDFLDLPEDRNLVRRK